MVIMSHHKSFQDVLWVTDVVCVKVHQTTINKDNQYFEMDLAVPIYTDKVGLYHFFRHVSVQKKKIKPKDQEPMEVLVLMSHLASFTNYVHPEGQMVKSSLEEINNNTDIKVSYKNKKKGRTVVALEFTVLSKEKKKDVKDNDIKKDNGDLFVIDGLSDAQLARIARSEQFKRDYNHLISPTSPINNDHTGQAWINHFVNIFCHQ